MAYYVSSGTLILYATHYYVLLMNPYGTPSNKVTATYFTGDGSKKPLEVDVNIHFKAS